MEFTDDFDSGVVDSRTKNDLGAATFVLPLGARGSSRTIAAYYENTDDFTLSGRFRTETHRSNSPYDDVAFSYDVIGGSLARRVRDRSLRQELTFRPLRRHLLGAGFEVHDLATRERLDVDLGTRPEEALRRASLSHDAARAHRRHGAWLYDRIRLAERVDVEAGLRYDESGINAVRELTPRVALRARLFPSTTLRAAFGIHTQSPGYEKLFQADYVLDFSEEGRLRLDNERARHYVLGLERALAGGLTARLEGFYKRFDDLILGRLETEDELAARLAPYDFPAELQASVPRQRQITADPVNEAAGRAYGFDFFLARQPTSSATRLSGWVAYTYTSADREAYGRTYPFAYEQPHALSVVVSFRAHQRLELALTGRFCSGFPRTAPVGVRVAGVRDAADADHDGLTGEIVPERDGEGALVYAVDYGGIDNLNRSRAPWYARVDGRATFVPRWGKGRWRLYVDLINLLGRNNGLVLEELAHDPASSRPRLVVRREGGFPFVPSFGVHVRF